MGRPAENPRPSDAFVIDTWAPLSHKAGIGPGIARGASSLIAPTWVGEHHRRLTAYRIYAAYIANCARHFINTTDAEVQANHREYGDAKLIRNQVVAALLGDQQEVTVDNARDYNPDLEKKPAEPALPTPAPPTGPVAPGAPPAPPQDAGATPGPSPEELKDNAEAKDAADREEWLRDWVDDDGFWQTLIETERNAVGLGDGVYVLSTDTKLGRVVCDPVDPGFYFPVLTDALRQRPERVHVAWEVERAEDGTLTPIAPGQTARSETKRYVRRITYELRAYEGTPPERGWEDEDADPSDYTCFMTDGLWHLPDATKGVSPDDFAGRPAIVLKNEDGLELEDVDLEIDFIPVLHVPNFVATADFWSEPVLAVIAHILDDLQYADTDMAAAAATTAAPPVWTAGAGVTNEDEVTYGPGQMYRMEQGGSLNVLDTSKALVALDGLVDSLLKRLSVNSRVPEGVLGRVSASDATSGIALALSFGPLASMIGEMRLVRDQIYPELFDMVQKLAMSQGWLEPGVPHQANVSFGSYLPVDKVAVVNQVTTLLQFKAISRETGLVMLVDAGFPIEDAIAELRRIEESDFEGAVKLLDALGAEGPVYEYLGRTPPPPRPASQVPAPAPGAVTGPHLGPIPPGAQPAPSGGAGPQPAPGTPPGQ